MASNTLASADPIVSAKEFREDFKANVLDICDFSKRRRGRPRNTIISHLIDPTTDPRLPEDERKYGTMPKQMTIDLACVVIAEMLQRYTAKKRSLDIDLRDIRNMKLRRTWAGKTMNSMVRFKNIEGLNDADGLRKGFGSLIVVAKRGVQNAYVATRGAGRFEITAFIELNLARGKTTVANAQHIKARNDRVFAGDDADKELDEIYIERVANIFRADDQDDED